MMKRREEDIADLDKKACAFGGKWGYREENAARREPDILRLPCCAAMKFLLALTVTAGG